MPRERPNVLVIMSDQHNAGVMRCAGDPHVRTPNIDRLAAGGVLLESLYCHAPLCAPSRMSFFTGMLPSGTGVLTNQHLANGALPTFAHSAGAAGYRPHLIGKMHAVGPDQLRGFASREVGDHGPNFPGGQRAALGAAAGTVEPGARSLQRIGRGRSFHRARDELAGNAAISFLRQHDIQQCATGRRDPFFLTVGLSLPHQPYVAPASDFGAYEGRIEQPRLPRADSPADRHPYLEWWRRTTGISDGVDPRTTLVARTAYWAMVTRLDAIIGSILDTLDEIGQADNTLVVYTSDHGDMLGEHGLWWKQTLLDPAIRVPGIIRWPGVIPAASRLPDPVGQVDVCASIIDAVGGPQLPRSSGTSLLPRLTGGAGPIHRPVFAENYVADTTGDGESRRFVQRMVRLGDDKYIDYGDQPAQLFDLASDPLETTDLADTGVHQRTTDALRDLARSGWDPAAVSKEFGVKDAETTLIRGWAQSVQPVDHFRLELDPTYTSFEDLPVGHMADQEL